MWKGANHEHMYHEHIIEQKTFFHRCLYPRRMYPCYYRPPPRTPIHSHVEQNAGISSAETTVARAAPSAPAFFNRSVASTPAAVPGPVAAFILSRISRLVDSRVVFDSVEKGGGGKGVGVRFGEIRETIGRP